MADMSGSGSRNPGDDGFLRRWVRRKAEVRRGGATEDSEAAPTDAGQPPVATASGVPEPAGSGDPPAPAEPEITDTDMPTLESLDQDSDYSPFLSRGVSAELRQKALRQLFRQPKFNVETCLDDFQDDYLNFQPLGDIVTCDMRHQTEVEARRKAEREAEDAAERVAQVAGAPESAAAPVPPDAPAADDVAAADPDPPAAPDEDDGTRTRPPPGDGGTAA